MAKLRIMRRGHDVKGFMITDDDSFEIIGKYKTEEAAQKVLNKMLKKMRL
jgi:hypothetical protein